MSNTRGGEYIYISATSFSFHFANLELFTMHIPPDNIVHEYNEVINRNRG